MMESQIYALVIPNFGNFIVVVFCHFVCVVVEPLVYFTFLLFNEIVITKTQGLVVAIAKREYINKSNKCIII